jgi:hypothetical protein
MDGAVWLDTSGDTIADLGGLARAAVQQMFSRAGALAAGAAPHPELRQEHTATTLAISREKAQEAIRRIRTFHRELTAWLGGDEADAVYRLELRFYPLTPSLERSAPDGTTGDTLADRDAAAG